MESVLFVNKARPLGISSPSNPNYEAGVSCFWNCGRKASWTRLDQSSYFVPHTVGKPKGMVNLCGTCFKVLKLNEMVEEILTEDELDVLMIMSR